MKKYKHLELSVKKTKHLELSDSIWILNGTWPNFLGYFMNIEFFFTCVFDNCHNCLIKFDS